MFFSMGGSPVHHLLILVAMDVEERAILDICPKFDDIEIDGRLGIFGKQLSFSNFKMTLVNTGIGLVNAGLATAVASQKLAVDAILLLGVAGALREDQEIGDIILADVILQHDSFFSSENSNEMMAPGFPYVSLNQSERESPVFRTDATFEKWLRSKSIVLSKGTILSGSEFVGSASRKKDICALHENSLAVEMESAAVALVAKKIGLPFAVIKTIADRLNPDGSISSDYNRFLKHAAGTASQVISLIIGDH